MVYVLVDFLCNGTLRTPITVSLPEIQSFASFFWRLPRVHKLNTTAFSLAGTFLGTWFRIRPISHHFLPSAHYDLSIVLLLIQGWWTFLWVFVKNEQIMIFELLIDDNELLVGREVFNRWQNKQKNCINLKVA